MKRDIFRPSKGGFNPRFSIRSLIKKCPFGLVFLISWLALFGTSATAESTHFPDIIFHFRGPDTLSFIGRVITPLGDVNNDGFYDIAVSCRVPLGIYLFYGGNPADTIPDRFFSGFRGTIKPIDLTGDGINEFIAYRPRACPSDRLSCDVFYFRGYADSIASEPYDSLTPDSLCEGFASYDWGGAASSGNKTAYVDSDSLGDFLTVKFYGLEGPEVLYYSGCPALDKEPDWTYVINNKYHNFAGCDFVDFNGDGELDICAGMRARDWRDTASYIYIFLGPDFGENPDVIIQEPAFTEPHSDLRLFPRDIVNIGDYDGDGWEDLGVPYTWAWVLAMIYRCGPGADTLYDYRLGGDAEAIACAGDINGDGHDDIIGGGSGSWEGIVYLYSGGHGADTIPDDFITYDMLPSYCLNEVGWRVSTAGDFNNDGYDDVMFSCQNFCQYDPWDVFIMAGSPEIPTPAGSHCLSASPVVLELWQNHPNPFNLETTIRFKLYRQESVTLEVYNVLGERVASLLSGTILSAGEHTLSWDGTDDRGATLSSGIYLCQLSTTSGTLARKMVLIK